MLRGVIVFAYAVLSASAGTIGIKQGKLSITSPDGLSDASYTLKEPTPLPLPIVLADATTLKLTFTVVETTSGDGIFPQQAHLLFEDPKGGNDVTLPINVKANGKASFTLNTAKPPSALTQTHGPLQLTLLVSSLASHTPLAYPLGEISLPASILTQPPRGRHDLPPRAGEPAFQPEQEISHTFRVDEKTVGIVKSALGTGLALSPWAVLAFLVGKVYPSLEMRSAPSSSYIFIGTLAALEALIFTYWVGLKLYEFLPYFLALSVISAYTGKVALGALRTNRLKLGGTP